MTKKQKTTQKHEIILLSLGMLAIAIVGYASNLPYAKPDTQNVISHRPIAPAHATATPAVKTTHSGTIREVTSYNAGDPNQTDATPCDGAGGNICEMLDANIPICAANFVPLGTWLYIENFGECQVLDRMAKRFSNRVDIAMKLSEKERALKFGRQNLLVTILK